MPLTVEQKEILNITSKFKLIAYATSKKSLPKNDTGIRDHWVLLDDGSCGIIQHFVQADHWVWFLIEEIHILRSQIYEKLDPTLYEAVVAYNSECLVEVDR